MYKRCELILKELENENKIKVWWDFKFPGKEPLKLRLKDMLEDKIDEKYYLSDYQIDKIKASNFMQDKCVQVANLKGGKWDKINESCRRIYSGDGLSPTIHTCQGGNTEPKVFTVGNVNPSGKGQNGKVIDFEGLARTITVEKGEGQKILIKNNTKKGYLEAYEGDGVYTNTSNKRGTVQPQSIQTITTRQDLGVVEKGYNNFIQKNGYVPELFNPYNESEIKDIAPTQTSNCGSTTGTASVLINSSLRIRKLTPRECWRLMGFDDKDFEKAQKENSNTQLYKQAGNSIVVNVLEKIFKNLLKGEK